MSGFDWNEFFAVFNTKMSKSGCKCTVGRYIIPKETQMPYVDVSLGDNSGGNYDLLGNEGSQNPMIIITVYDTGNLADSNCNDIANKAKKIMLSYGFQCKTGPIPVTNASDINIKRWVARYQRIFCAGDKLTQIK